MPGEPLQYSQITGTTSTSAAPTCATARRNMSAMSTEAKGTRAIHRPTAPISRLHQRRDDHAARHAADGLPRQADRRFAALAAEARAEAQHPAGGALSVGVQDCRGNHREQQLDEELAEAAHLGDEPGHEIAPIGCDSFPHQLEALRVRLLPELGQRARPRGAHRAARRAAAAP